MKFICSTADIVAGVNNVSKAVPTSTTMSLMQCILIRVGNGEIRLTANNNEMGIETVIGGTIDIAGMVAIEAKMLSDVVHKLPSGDVTIESDDDFNVYITSNEIKFELHGRSGEEFTFLPKVDKEQEIAISMMTFKDIVRLTNFSVGHSESNKTMEGERFVIKNDSMRITSLDGHRVSITKVELGDTYPERTAIIPGDTLSDINKIVEATTEKNILMYFSDSYVVFEFDNTTVVSRLIDGKFINVDRMISTDYDTKVRINCRSFNECIGRSMLISKDGSKKPIVIEVRGNKLSVNVNAVNGGFHESIDVTQDGEDVRIGFNPKFISDVLRAIDDEEIDLYFVDSRSPMYIKDENEKYLFMILPINLS